MRPIPHPVPVDRIIPDGPRLGRGFLTLQVKERRVGRPSLVANSVYVVNITKSQDFRFRTFAFWPKMENPDEKSPEKSTFWFENGKNRCDLETTPPSWTKIIPDLLDELVFDFSTHRTMSLRT